MQTCQSVALGYATICKSIIFQLIEPNPQLPPKGVWARRLASSLHSYTPALGLLFYTKRQSIVRQIGFLFLFFSFFCTSFSHRLVHFGSSLHPFRGWVTTPSELHRRETTTVHLAKTRYVYIARKYFKPPVQVTTNTVRQSVRKPVRPIRVLLLPATKIIPIRESVLSPQDTQSKLLKEDNFALFFHDAFGCNIDTFINLDKDDILSKFQYFQHHLRGNGNFAAGKQASI